MQKGMIMDRGSPESDLPYMKLWMSEPVYKWIYVWMLGFWFLISDTSDGEKVESNWEDNAFLDSL